MTGAQVFSARFFFDKSPPGAVDDVRAPFARLQGSTVYHPPCLPGERDMKGNDVGEREPPREIVYKPDSGPLRFFGGNIGVVGRHLHAEGPAPESHLCSYPSQPYDKESLSRKLTADKFAPFPFSRCHRTEGLRNLADEGEHHGHGVFGGSQSVPRRGVDYDDASAACLGKVYVVEADTGPRGCFQFLRRAEDLRVQWSAATGYHSVDTGYRLEEFIP